MWHGMLRVKPISISALKSGEPVHGMSRFENFYDGILQVANTQSFFKEHSAGFHTAEAKGI